MHLSLPDVLEVLDTLAAQIAAEIHTFLAQITILRYANVLTTLSWFMDGNDACALLNANQPQSTLGLREVLRSHDQDEGGYATYTLRDLSALGFQPPPAVRRSQRLVDRWEVVQKLGYSATVESIATQLGPSVLAMRDRPPGSAGRPLSAHRVTSGGGCGGTQSRRAATVRHATYFNVPQGVAFLGGRAWGAMIVDAR